MRPEASQEAVAHDASISLRHYQKIEKAVGDPKLTTLLDIARALGTTLKSLLEDARL